MCDECYGIYENCPMCSEEPKKEKCEACNGEGVIYVTAENGECDYETYLQAAEDERFVEACSECGGEGEI